MTRNTNEVLIPVHVWGDVDPLPLLQSYGLEPEDYEILHHEFYSADEVEILVGESIEDEEYTESVEVPCGFWILSDTCPWWQVHQLTYLLGRRWDQLVVRFHCSTYWSYIAHFDLDPVLRVKEDDV